MIQLNHEKDEIYTHEYSESPSLISLINIMRKKVERYQESIKSIEIERLSKDSLEYYFFIEGRIRYLILTERNIVFSNKKNPLAEEFVSLCNQANRINRNSYNASVGMAELSVKYKDFSKALQLYKKMYDFGYKSESILDMILSNSLILRDWTNYKTYMNFSSSDIYKIILKLLYLDARYLLFKIPYTGFCFFFSYILGWNLSLLLVSTFIFLLLICYFFYRRRTFFLSSIYYFITSFLALVFWIFYMK